MATCNDCVHNNNCEWNHLYAGDDDAFDCVDFTRNSMSHFREEREQVVRYLKENPPKSCLECWCFINRGIQGIGCIVSGILDDEAGELMEHRGRAKRCVIDRGF